MITVCTLDPSMLYICVTGLHGPRHDSIAVFINSFPTSPQAGLLLHGYRCTLLHHLLSPSLFIHSLSLPPHLATQEAQTERSEPKCHARIANKYTPKYDRTSDQPILGASLCGPLCAFPGVGTLQACQHSSCIEPCSVSLSRAFSPCP